MKRIKYIVRKEFLQLFRDKKLLPPVFAAPIIQLILLGYAVTLDVKNITLSVYDTDNSYSSRELVSSFTSSGYFILKFHSVDYRQLEQNIQDNHISMGLVIPADFEKKLDKGNTAPVQLLIDGSDANTANIGLAYANGVIAHFTQSYMKNKKLPIKVSKINAQFRSWYNQELKSKYFMIPGVLALLLMIITMMLTSMVIVKEKEIGTMEQLIVTPIKPIELIAGKLIPFVIVGFIDINLVLCVAYFWFGIPLKGSILLLYLLSGTFILTTLGLGLFISTISKTQQQAMMITNFMFMMPFLYLSGFIFPVENMPKILQYVTYIIPLKYYLIIVRGIFLKGVGFNYLWGDFLVLLLIGTGVFTVSVLRFHKKLE